MNSKISVFKYLPDELVLQILVRSTIVSIFKFKSVCKLWYNLLSTNYFTKLYNQISMRNPMAVIDIYDDSSNSESDLFCAGTFDDVSDINLDFIKDKVRIAASSNGLLLCSSIANISVNYVCNPMTRQYKVLPENNDELITHEDGKGARFMGLVCDLLNRKFNVVLAGYSWSVERRGIYTLTSLVYDSETDRWNKFSYFQDGYYFINMNINPSVLPDFILNNGMLCSLSMCCTRIMIHDMKLVICSRITSPIEVRIEKGNRGYLLEFDGLLSIAETADAFLTIWVLKDRYTENWEVVEKLNISRIKGMVTHIYRISQSGNYMFFATHKKVVMYNRGTKAWTDLFSVKDGCALPLRFTTHSFRATLFSFKD